MALALRVKSLIGLGLGLDVAGPMYVHEVKFFFHFPTVDGSTCVRLKVNPLVCNLQSLHMRCRLCDDEIK
jgi:hypothetical protein